MKILQRNNFSTLLDALKNNGYAIVGPTVQDQAIVYDYIEEVNDLPIGWGDEQEPGKYRIKRRGDEALFGYVVSPTSWKRFLYPPKQKLWESHKNKEGFEIKSEDEQAPQLAFLGVRSCELHAIAIQDKVFTKGSYVDSHYKKRRDKSLLIAVNCGQAASTCFCTSMNTGPKANEHYDLVMTEVLNDNKHFFLIDSRTKKGEEIVASLSLNDADDGHSRLVDQVVQGAVDDIQKSLNTDGIKELLYNNQEHPQWEDVAQRCLSCANCTMVCPTCFCSTVEDVTDLTGDHAERWRLWDSCFTMDFSYIHGGHIRSSTKSRYRQWMTHKLASWHDQFETSGCVGCGRCISWCPVGIDITEETRVIRESDGTTAKASNNKE